MLSGIDLDSGIRLKQAFVSLYMSLDFRSPGNLTIFLKTRMLDDTNKLSKCVLIARLYLEVSPVLAFGVIALVVVSWTNVVLHFVG